MVLSSTNGDTSVGNLAQRRSPELPAPSIPYLLSLPVLRLYVVGIGATLAFLGGFGLAAIWVFDDQRRRCSECLRRLARPVTMGSWGSMFEPVTTEFLCDEGHGALSLAESEIGDGDRWVSLDASWREL